MRTDPKIPITEELEGNARKLRRQAQQVEKQWRSEQGLALGGSLPAKAIIKRKRQPLERREIERREQRRRQWIERQVLRMPLLNGVDPA